MNTINGNRDLSYSYGCTMRLKCFHTGLEIETVVAKYKKEIIRLWICPHVYSLDLDWKIIQPDGFIYVKELDDLPEKVIFDKFNRKKEYKVIQHSNEYIGIPENIDIWYDQNLVISK